MGTFILVFNQVLIMFILMGVGFLSGKLGFIHEDGSNDMTQILCYIVSPCVIIKAFQQPFTSSRAMGLIAAFFSAVILFIFSIVVSRIIFSKKNIKEDVHRSALQFGSVYSNAGFIGIPLVNAILGTEGIFYEHHILQF